MRYFRRLPPLLRVASILGLLFALASIVGFVEVIIAVLSSIPRSPVDPSRMLVIALNLGMLGLACNVAVNSYSMRFRQPDKRPFPLDSWQSQVRTILLLAALPIAALVLAVAIPPTSLAFGIVFPISIIGVIVLVVATLQMNIGRRAMD